MSKSLGGPQSRSGRFGEANKMLAYIRRAFWKSLNKCRTLYWTVFWKFAVEKNSLCLKGCFEKLTNKNYVLFETVFSKTAVIFY